MFFFCIGMFSQFYSFPSRISSCGFFFASPAPTAALMRRLPFCAFAAARFAAGKQKCAPGFSAPAIAAAFFVTVLRLARQMPRIGADKDVLLRLSVNLAGINVPAAFALQHLPAGVPVHPLIPFHILMHYRAGHVPVVAFHRARRNRQADAHRKAERRKQSEAGFFTVVVHKFIPHLKLNHFVSCIAMCFPDIYNIAYVLSVVNHSLFCHAFIYNFVIKTLSPAEPEALSDAGKALIIPLSHR